MIQYYIPKPLAVKAIILTEDNIKEVQNFACGTLLKAENNTYRLFQSSKATTVHFGDFIVQDTNGDFQTYTPTMFNAMYDLVTNMKFNPIGS